MLKSLRKKKTAKKVWIILAILILPAFVLWGSGSLVRNKQEAPGFAGKIFGKKISDLEYKDALEAVKNAAIMQFGDNYHEIQKYLNLGDQAWDRLILLHEAKKRNITASDREVIELIESYPFFQRKGQFNNKIYTEMLQYVFRTQPRVFEEETRQNILLSKLYKEITNEVTITDAEVKDEYLKYNEELSLYYIASLISDFTKEVTTSDAQIKDYFEKNSLQFKQPLSFNVDFIVLESEDKAKEAAGRLKKSKDFEKIAKDLGAEVKTTGLFGQTDPIPGIGWSPELFTLIQKMKLNQYSAPIKMDKYFYILKLKERKDAYIPELQNIKDKVKEALIKEKAAKIAKEKIEDCLKKMYRVRARSADFNKFAKECGLKSDATGLFKFGSYIEGIGSSDNFWTAAKLLKDNEFSQVISMPSGFYIIKVKSRTPVDQQKFESEKEDFSQKLLAQKKQEYFTKYVEELKKKAL